MNQESKKGINYREIGEVALKSLVFVAVAGTLTMLLHMFTGRYILHIHGKPEFVSTSLTIYSAFDKMLLALGYYLLGRKIPIKNNILRGLAYVGLNYLSNFVPQFMGLAFADGSIAQMAFSFIDLACDTIVYTILGIMLGLMYKKVTVKPLRLLDKGTFGKAIVSSAVVFPAFIIVADRIMDAVLPMVSSAYVIGVSEQAKTAFLINFYSWFILTGALFSVFYRFTEYNDYGNYIKFALKYGLLLWTPVVMIMVVFGTSLLPTTIYALLFIACIFLVSRINDRIMSK